MKPLETYLHILWSFIQAVRHGTVLNMPCEDDHQLAYLHLNASGAWEITRSLPDPLMPAPEASLFIPLVLPLSPIILAAHTETQWISHQRQQEPFLLHS
jgi:hypothetical protein